jgi:hypothetical protein
MTMAEVDVTTDANDTSTNSAWELPHRSERVDAEAPPHDASDADIGRAAESVCQYGDKCLVSPLEAAIEAARERLMRADSVLGCLQIALDPEAVRVTPEPYFPEVVELAREYINTSIRHLEYQEVRRLVHCSMGCYG